MPGFGLTGFTPRKTGVHRFEAAPPGREIIDSQDQIVEAGWRPVLVKERMTDGQLSYVGGDPEVPYLYGAIVNVDEPLAQTFRVGDGDEGAASDLDYVNLEGEHRTNAFVRQSIVPMQLGSLDKLHGWRQDTDLVDTAWPYRLIAGVDYSGPAHPQHSNIWNPRDPSLAIGQGNYDPLLTQTPLYQADVASAFPPDHPVAGDAYGIIGPNEYA